MSANRNHSLYHHDFINGRKTFLHLFIELLLKLIGKDSEDIEEKEKRNFGFKDRSVSGSC